MVFFIWICVQFVLYRQTLLLHLSCLRFHSIMLCVWLSTLWYLEVLSCSISSMWSLLYCVRWWLHSSQLGVSHQRLYSSYWHCSPVCSRDCYQHLTTPKIFRTDNALEFTHAVLQRFVLLEVIIYQIICPYILPQNCVAERNAAASLTLLVPHFMKYMSLTIYGSMLSWWLLIFIIIFPPLFWLMGSFFIASFMMLPYFFITLLLWVYGFHSRTFSMSLLACSSSGKRSFCWLFLHWELISCLLP